MEQQTDRLAEIQAEWGDAVAETLESPSGLERLIKTGDLLVAEVQSLRAERDTAKAESVQALARHYGCGEHITFSDAWRWLAERVELSRLAQELLATHKSDAATAEGAIRERVKVIEAERDTLREALATVHDLVQSACDDIDTYVDVDDGEDGQPVANKAMHAQCALEEAMTRLERLSQSSPTPPAQETQG